MSFGPLPSLCLYLSPLPLPLPYLYLSSDFPCLSRVWQLFPSPYLPPCFYLSPSLASIYPPSLDSIYPPPAFPFPLFVYHPCFPFASISLTSVASIYPPSPVSPFALLIPLLLSLSIPCLSLALICVYKSLFDHTYAMKKTKDKGKNEKQMIRIKMMCHCKKLLI